ncbi:hypothetical protein LJC08_03905 [Methanimicrococcus sp. OttesenSCG-928-J09]|nr:hypothetical protein [Methanimicrococcus sp. OttesenSCG-928-J09]
MNQNNTEKSKNNSEAASMILKNVNEFGLFSFEREEMREESTIAQAGQMLVALSVFSAVVLMLTPILMDRTEIDNIRIYVFLIVVLGLLSICFVCAVLAQSKYDYFVPANIDQIYQNIYDSPNEFSELEDFLLLKKNQISEIHRSKKEINDKRVRLLQLSLNFLVFSIIIANFLILLIYCY